MEYKLTCGCGRKVIRKSPINFAKKVRCEFCRKENIRIKRAAIRKAIYFKEKIFRIRRRLLLGLSITESQLEFIKTNNILVDNFNMEVKKAH